MIVYRVEHPDTGIGPYRNHTHKSSEIDDALCQHSWSTYQSPLCIWDYENYDDLLFGFNSLKQLEKWFGAYIEILSKAGYIIRQYRVAERKVLDGLDGKQLVFYKTAAYKRKVVDWKILRAIQLREQMKMEIKRQELECVAF